MQAASQLCLSSLQQLPPQPSSSCISYPPPRPRPDSQCSASQNNLNEQVIPNNHLELREARSLNLNSCEARSLNLSSCAGSSSHGPSTSHHIGLPGHQSIYSVIGEPGNLTGTECTICYENPIDSVLYMCGHMCMCYRCAVQQWRGKGGGQCPLCRAHIKDVIRTYKS